MTDQAKDIAGHVILVTFKGLGPARPLSQIYDVATPDGDAAITAVMGFIAATDEVIEVVDTLSQGAVTALGLQPGEVRPR